MLGTDGTIYFGTWGAGPYETNAIYALNPDSTLKWRFPSDTSLTKQLLFSSPALSPDNATVYFSGFFDGDTEVPARMFALDLTAGDNVQDADRLKWEFELRKNDQPVWTTTLAVGSDGTIFVGGLLIDGNVNVPVLLALQDNGLEGAPTFKWASQFIELRDGAQWVGGIALREIAGQTVWLYVTTANLRTANNNESGSLYAVDPQTGEVLATYDPSDEVSAAVGGLNSPAIGADGIIYFGVRGKFAAPFVNPVNGHVFAVEYDAQDAEFRRLWNFELDGHTEWSHPAIGPGGGIYVGSSAGGVASLKSYDPGEVPPGTTCHFYGIKGPTNPLAVRQNRSLPETFTLEQNYPNPFNPETTIRFHLPEAAGTTLAIYNLLGQKVRTLVHGTLAAGRYSVKWDGRDERRLQVPSGGYVFELRATGFVQRRKMLLVR